MKRVRTTERNHLIAFLAIALLSGSLYGREVSDCESLIGRAGLPKGADAVAINTAGYRLYKEQDYRNAADLFYCAAQRDAKYANAHYNLACTLSLLYADGGEEVDVKEIVRHLEKTLKLAPAKIEKMTTDEDLFPISCTPEYQEFIKGHAGSLMRPYTVVAFPEEINFFEGDTKVTFKGADGKIRLVDLERVESLQIVFNEEDSDGSTFPQYSINPEKQGKRYRLTVARGFGVQALSGYCHFVESVIKVEPVDQK